MKRFFAAAAVLVAALLLSFAPAWGVTRTATFTQTLNTSTKTSDSFDPGNGGQSFGFSVAVTGTFSANWRLQLSLDAGSTWVDFFVIDQADVVAIPTQANALWRVSAAGVGDFTSGSASVTFEKGGAQASTPLLRLLTKDRAAVSTTNPLPVTGAVTSTSTLAAGEAHIGEIGGAAIMVGNTMTKSTKTTAYSSGQMITQGNAGASSGISIQVARANDKTGMVRRVRLKVNDSTWLNATVRVHIFKDTPTFTNGDAGNFAAGISESNHVCYIDVLLDLSFSSTTVKGTGVPAIGNECNFEPSSGTRNVFVVFEARSTTAGSHTASSVFTPTLEVLQN